MAPPKKSSKWVYGVSKKPLLTAPLEQAITALGNAYVQGSKREKREITRLINRMRRIIRKHRRTVKLKNESKVSTLEKEDRNGVVGG